PPSQHLPTPPVAPLTPSAHAAPATQHDPLSLHDALPISYSQDISPSANMFFERSASRAVTPSISFSAPTVIDVKEIEGVTARERSESTRLNSSHVAISYAVFCLKKKKP